MAQLVGPPIPGEGGPAPQSSVPEQALRLTVSPGAEGSLDCAKDPTANVCLHHPPTLSLPTRVSHTHQQAARGGGWGGVGGSHSRVTRLRAPPETLEPNCNIKAHLHFVHDFSTVPSDKDLKISLKLTSACFPILGKGVESWISKLCASKTLSTWPL